MKILLIINAAFEGIFGIIAIAIPQQVWAGSDGLAQSIGRAFGFAALTVPVLCILALKHLDERGVRLVVLGTMVAWHLGLTVAETAALIQHFAPPPVAIIHGIFAVAFIIFLVRSLRSPAQAAR